MDDILYLVIFLFLLIILPMAGFFVIRRVFRIFRFIPYLMREVIVPQMKMAAEDGEGNHHKTKLSPEQIRIIENSVLTSSLEVNPKRFTKKAKKRLSLAGIFFGITILGVVLYKVFWVIYDFIVLTYF